MIESGIKKIKYKELLKDLDFDRIELELRTPNIFHILDISRAEIRHSNFLLWLLDPNGTHGLGNLFLIKFLRELATYEISSSDLNEFEIGELDFNNVEIRKEWRNIDLLILFDKLVICIENKVDSQDHSNQLSKYRTIINETFKKHKKVFVYLTPMGEQPNEEEEREHYKTYSYENISNQIERILEIHGKSLNPGVYQYIFDYLTILKRDLMKNDKLNQLAEQIYNNHKEIFDFVMENKPDIVYSEQEHLDKGNDEIQVLYKKLKKAILNLDSSLEVKINKLYIAFFATNNVVNIQIQRSKLKLLLNVKKGQLKDSEKCTDASSKGTFATGDYEITMQTDEDLEYILDLIKQSLELNK